MDETPGSVNLILGACSQLPVGCSDIDLESWYQRYYKPLAQLAYRFADCAWMLHLGGELLEWIDRQHPELIMLLREMVKRRQLEILGGGFYAPVLPIIPALDRVGQIEKLTTGLRVRFGTRPRGVWLSDCVWEPSLPHTLAGSGMEYTFLDRAQFAAAGVSGDQLCSAHLTEDEGRVIAVIPICFRLSVLMETATPEDAVDTVVSGCTTTGDRVVVAADEPERLGDHCWMERFLHLVSTDERIGSITPRAYLRRHGTHGFVYLGCGMSAGRAAYSNEGTPAVGDTGAREADSAADGVFRRYLSCSADSRFLYAKMVHANLLVNQVRGDRERRRAAREDLWRGQCGHAYWPRTDGGIGTRRTRDAAYASLLQAEFQSRDETSFLPSIMRTDYDMDGVAELLYHGRLYNAYVHTTGGMLFELDYLPGSVNFMNTLTRGDGQGLGPADPYLRRGFLDHFLAAAPTVEDYSRGFGCSPGLVAEPYVVQSLDGDSLTLLSDVAIPADGDAVPIAAELSKSYRFRARSLEVRYDLVATGDVDAWLVVETNLAVGADSIWQVTGPRSSRRLTRRATSFGPNTLVEIDDPGASARLTIRTGDAQAGVYSPVHAAGEYQYCALVIAWRLRAAAGQRWTRRVSIAFSRWPGSARRANDMIP